MEKLGRFVVGKRVAVIIIFLILIIPSVLGMIKTKINYDLLSYIPDNLNSKKGQIILNENFGLAETVYLAVHDKEIWEVMEIKEEILKLEGVGSVDWLDDYADIKVPPEFISDDIKENFISENSTILQVRLGENKNGSNNLEVIDEIKKACW